MTDRIKTLTPEERKVFWDSIVGERCKCGCPKSRHTALHGPNDHSGRCLNCGRCKRFTWASFIMRKKKKVNA